MSPNNSLYINKYPTTDRKYIWIYIDVQKYKENISAYIQTEEQQLNMNMNSLSLPTYFNIEIFVFITKYLVCLSNKYMAIRSSGVYNV